MTSDYLSPISKNFIDFKNKLPNNSLGKKIVLFNNNKFDYNDIDIALLGISEYRNSVEIKSNFINLDEFRKEFYSLYYGDWNFNILDLGDLINGDNYNDTYFAFKIISEELFKQNVKLIIVGGGNDFTYPLYQSLSKIYTSLNISSVDNRFDFGRIEKEFDSNSYMSKIIMDKNNCLNHFCNIGFQTFLNSQEEIDLLNKLNFEFHRIGDLNKDIQKVEPLLRNTHLLSIDFKSIKASELNFVHNFSNGFESDQLCSISRYAGLSNSISAIGFFELLNSSISSSLLSQAIWYFIEGLSLRIDEDPKSKSFNGYTYNVICEGINLKFYNSELSQKWWVEFISKKKYENIILLPCDKNDYLNACDEFLSDRLILLLRRDFV
tara:strand:+ start:139 stop:1275 length:1137 start_codon:yes stop_codon:yes gene_type:complete